jgi:hypothetical protein
MVTKLGRGFGGRGSVGRADGYELPLSLGSAPAAI